MYVTSPFDRSCANIAIPCVDGTYYIDPCSCTHYYRCASTQKVDLLNCSAGTLFHPTRNCDTASDDSCKAEKPWERCSDGGGGGENGGAIAGAIVAVLIVTVIVVCIVLYVRKRGNPIRQLKQTSFWRGMTRTGERTENDATSPAVHVTTSPPEPVEEVYAHIDDLKLWRDSQLITTRATAPPRDLANTHHQQIDYVMMLAGGQKTNKRQSPEQHTPNLPGHNTQTQDFTGLSTQTRDLVSYGKQTQDLAWHRKQTRDLVCQNKKTEDLAGHGTQTQDLTGHSTQSVTNQSSPLYSGLAEVDDGLYVHAYAVVGSQS